eukprot:721964-Amphidinium_carterae.1
MMMVMMMMAMVMVMVMMVMPTEVENIATKTLRTALMYSEDRHLAIHTPMWPPSSNQVAREFSFYSCPKPKIGKNR